MKLNYLFGAGIAINLLAFLIAVSNSFLTYSPVQSSSGSVIYGSDSLTPYGKMMNWLVPLALLAVIVAGFWLRSKSKMVFANILVWIPALPMLFALTISGGLAVLFILFGN